MLKSTNVYLHHRKQVARVLAIEETKEGNQGPEM